MTPRRPHSTRVGSRPRLAALTSGLLLLGLAPRGFALDPGKAVTQYMHEVWQTEQGLPQNTVNAIAQTPDGYLWIGTREGLVRFDGVRFTVFDTRTTPELGHNFVLCLRVDQKGRLWIGTSGGGLVRREGERFTRYGTKDGLPNPQVSALFEDGKGQLWVGTDGGGLARLRGRPARARAVPGLPRQQRAGSRRGRERSLDRHRGRPGPTPRPDPDLVHHEGGPLAPRCSRPPARRTGGAVDRNGRGAQPA